MFVYNLETREIFGSLNVKEGLPVPEARDSVYQSGDAVLVVFPFKYPDTFDFQTLQTGSSIVMENANDAGKDDAMTMADPILLDRYIVSLAIRDSKESHTGSLQVALKDPNHVHLSVINPGDWVMCWMFDNKSDATALRKVFSEKLVPRNSFLGGLKFVGKVYSVRQNKGVSQTGAFVKNVQLMAASFTEFNQGIYYDPWLIDHKTKNVAEFITTIGTALAQKIPDTTQVSGIVSMFLAAFFGFPPNYKGGTASKNVPVQIPEAVATLLGRNDPKNYLDILETHIGIQEYGDSYVPLLQDSTQEFLSDRTTITPYPSIRFCPKALVGFNNPMPDPFNNVPLWSILNQYSVPIANEMYTCLRLGEKGDIVPHFIVRQRPFSTDNFAKQHARDGATAFLSLPRWLITDKLITAFDTGKSDSLRANFIQVQPTGQGLTQGFQAFLRAETTPRWDDDDIKRHGLRPHISQALTTMGPDPIGSAQKWTDLLSDQMIGSHLKLSGSLSCVGIQEPICVGDNLQYDGIVYHIETVEHRLIVAQSGHKSFSTHLAISHGVPASGVAFPEIEVRKFDAKKQIIVSQGTNPDQMSEALAFSKKFIGTGKSGHSATPSTTFEEDP